MWSFVVLWLSAARLGAAVLCPNGQVCDRGTSCCWLPGGKSGCCPLVQEVRGSLPMVQTGSLNDISGVLCPNKATCPSEYSCLQIPGGSYACCPFGEAVSCEDGKHCCPRGFRCNGDGRLCLGHSGSNEVTAIICPGGEMECPNDSTCCEMTGHSWGCCPFPQATCCKDLVHCCPQGTTCDVAHGKCISAEGQTPMWTKFAARTRAPWEKNQEDVPARVPCPDKSTCPDGTTCCQMADSKYGCCPIVDAVCCDDHVHCCPHDTTCDVPHGKCSSKAGSSPLLPKSLALEPSFTKTRALKEKVEFLPCDDISSCPDKQTCCSHDSGNWSCCPLEKAVCCKDHSYCCPNSTTCDTAHGSCTASSQSIPWISVTLLKEPLQNLDVQCDATTRCNDRNTCCKTESGGWACCPLPQAVCCEDHVHCCPNGYTCDVKEGSCKQGSKSVPWLTKTEARVKAVPSGQDVHCDDTSSCHDNSTCCRSSSGEWACCPLPSASCCEDHVHCCPSGYTCDVEQQSCKEGSQSTPWPNKSEAHVVEVPQSRAVHCDDTSSCTDNSTCCKSASGGWACCHLPSAVCCEDHEHCCPSGASCNVEQQTCKEGSLSTPWHNKTAAHIEEVSHSKDVPCDDRISCPDNTSCCKTKSGGWACCPLPSAVCCDDHVHCCPSGYSCNVEEGSCKRSSQSTRSVSKAAPSMGVTPPSKDVYCDDTSSCPDSNTCCKSTSGDWSCCPLPNATCCEDHMHCCPSGYTCNVEEGSCKQGSQFVPWLSKYNAHIVEVQSSKDVRCDDTSSCPDSSTCCKSITEGWACCPLASAVCCTDHVHCCPTGYTCNVTQGTCLKGDSLVARLTKTPARVNEALSVMDVLCDDTTRCPAGNTCCRKSTGEWGCCPLAKAVCCSDHVHCCPNGYTCNVAEGTCLQGDAVVTWLTKTPAQVNVSHREVIPCDDAFSCPDGNTCCILPSGEWGCCPYVMAVCCSDHVHCCPNGYTCNVAQGSCLQGNDVVVLVGQTPAHVKEALTSRDVRCDDTLSCPDGNTCCKLASGQWGCCPIVQAVCCDDLEHCCPHGYTCDVAKGTCIQGKSIPWFTKRNALVKEVVLDSQAVPCNDSYFCPDATTCCKTITGSWSCCPQIQAVCCSDRVHCCPFGSTCDLSTGKCIQGTMSVPWLTKNAAHIKKEALQKGGSSCDEKTSCPRDSTCCKSGSNDWACCPLLQAVCCTDGHHCCPSGYRCVADSCVQDQTLRWDGNISGNRKMKIL